MMMKYKYRADGEGTSKWYQTDSEDFKNFWKYMKGDIMWCVVKRERENFYHYYHSGRWTKLPMTANYNFN